MLKPGALLLLLAVAASQVDLHLSTLAGETDISACPITFYGRMFTRIQVSFSNSHAAVCFKNSPSDPKQDCLLIEDRQSADRASVESLANTTNPGSAIHQALPNIMSASPCLVKVALQGETNTSHLIVFIYNFGAQAALQLNATSLYNQTHVTVNATFGKSSLGSWSFEAQSQAVVDISGCRLSGSPLAASSERINPETCSRETCNASAVLSTVSTCGPMEVCQANNGCRPDTVVCTVTGSSVVTFLGRVHSVPDRCVYSLMKPQGSADFNLLAGFQERRRKDVMFLDHLILWLRGPGVKIYLEQGGRVRVDGQLLNLSTTAQLIHGVMLSKDQSGVTATIPFSNSTVFFDGYTAHVAGHIAGVEGLCGSPSNSSQTTSLSAAKSSSHSPAGCEIQHKDTADNTINCNRTTEHCNLMRKAPFTACHNHTDPAAYITACTNTLCKYPAVDGLNCQLLEAYAKACSLRSQVTLGDWRSLAGCPAAPQAFCQDQYCSAHEFCGEKPFGDTRCLCRSIFASKYRSSNTLGEPTVCMQNSATMTLAGCLLEDKGIDYSVLHLNDESCKGHMDNQTHMVTFSFDSSDTCGMEVMMNNSQIIYKNTIMTRNSSMYSVITRHDQVQIDFSCFYAKPDIKTVAFKIKDSSVVQQIVSGVWNYTLRMNAYTDHHRMRPVGPSTEIRLNQRVWMELKTEGLDDKMVVVVTDSCWATSQPSPDGGMRYNLIINGCPNPTDKTVKVENNGLGTSNYFSFNMFEFSGKNSDLYLHCKLELCLKQSKSCAPSCGQVAARRRRSARTNNANENPAFISMAWTN